MMKKIHRFDIVHDGQQMFRLILKALSNPLQKVNMQAFSEKMFGANKDFLAIAFTLLDNETTFCTFENTILDEQITSLTLSQKTTADLADFIFVDNEKSLETAVQTAKCGTLIDPHKSATIVVKIPSEHTIAMTFYGAGIDEKITVGTNALVDRAITLRNQMYFEYPLGLDFIFIDELGDLFAIPRLVNKEGI